MQLSYEHDLRITVNDKTAIYTGRGESFDVWFNQQFSAVRLELLDREYFKLADGIEAARIKIEAIGAAIEQHLDTNQQNENGEPSNRNPTFDNTDNAVTFCLQPNQPNLEEPIIDAPPQPQPIIDAPE